MCLVARWCELYVIQVSTFFLSPFFFTLDFVSFSAGQVTSLLVDRTLLTDMTVPFGGSGNQ